MCVCSQPICYLLKPFRWSCSATNHYVAQVNQKRLYPESHLNIGLDDGNKHS